MASFGHSGMGLRLFHRFASMSSTNIIFSVCVILSVKVSPGAADISSSQEPAYFDQFYAEGVKAYTDQLWYKCAHNLERAVEDYKTYRKTLTDCRMRCKQKAHEDEELPDLGDLTIFQSFLKRANCFRRCKSDAYERRPGFRLTKVLEETFERRLPYQYLQYCWYKLDRVKLAAAASYTYYLKNPEDKDVMRNIAYYRDRARVPESEFVDMELVPYKEHYIRALVAYREDDYHTVTENLEKAVAEFLVEEERCRTDCEDTVEGMENSTSSHFSGTVADHFIKVLECQLGCEGNLSVVYTEPEKNFFANHYHYLQYAYYKTDEIDKAVRATASYLLLDPEDKVMNENKNVFVNSFDYKEEQFVPTEEARKYAEQKKKLRTLYDFLQENFMKEVEDVIFVTMADAESEPLSQEAPTAPTTNYRTWMEQYERLGLHLIARGKDLHRPYRFAADGLLKQEQCDELLALVEDVPVDEKGAQVFTLAHARENAPDKDENYEASLRLFIRATEVMRHYTQRYYNMTGTLYFKQTNIVCWQQLPAPIVKNDCVPQEFGTCEPEVDIQDSEPKQDEFVVVTYLTSVDDADFYFLGDDVTIESSLGVKQGRTVGFRSGDRHGVHLPNGESRRCGLVNHYTTYRSAEEQDYTQTVEVLQRLDEIRMEKGLKDRAKVMKQLSDMGVRITKNSTDLHGGERFVADGLASEAECSSLKNMVMSGALVGDGYDRLEVKPSFISPHTEHELFQGLTIYRASKLMHSGVVTTFAMKSFLDLSEKSRLLVEKYFNLTKPLYFDFTHLVCRTPVDETKERKDLSHPVHADNCVIQEDGSCLKEYPAYVQRDYSALLYLNDDFRGGEFFFAHPDKSEQVLLNPRCGRLVGFNAKEYHGVRAVQGGTRCALAMWFTHNSSFKELAHVHARKVLTALQASRDVTQKEEPVPEDSDYAADQEGDAPASASENKPDSASEKVPVGSKEENKTASASEDKPTLTSEKDPTENKEKEDLTENKESSDSENVSDSQDGDQTPSEGADQDRLAPSDESDSADDSSMEKSASGEKGEMANGNASPSAAHKKKGDRENQKDDGNDSLRFETNHDNTGDKSEL